MTSPDAPDRRPVSALQPPPTDHQPGVAGNERLTALTAAILLPLIVAEIATIANIRALMSTHVVVGVLLAGPLTVKTASTGWRFIRYYTHQPDYQRKGPPRPLQRATAPLLLIATLVLIGSGIGLAATRPGTVSPLYITHKVSFLAWAVLLGIHLLAYIWRGAPARRQRLAALPPAGGTRTPPPPRRQPRRPHRSRPRRDPHPARLHPMDPLHRLDAQVTTEALRHRIGHDLAPPRHTVRRYRAQGLPSAA
jgi:hypothetical protein